MNGKKWVKFWLGGVLICLTLFAGFNYAIDPLWTFSHSHRYNNAQVGFDERQLKTNRAYFGGLDKYDALLLGSSRTTYIDQNDFKNLKVFNYSCSSMYPNEYKGWIDSAKTIKGDDFKTILIGVDFYGSNAGAFAQGQKSSTPPPQSYLEKSRSLMYRYRELLVRDTLDRSIESIEHANSLGTTDYTRENAKKTIRISSQRKQEAVNFQTGLYANQIYGETYLYDAALKAEFEALKKENPHSKFIIFTTPIAKSLFEILVQSGRLGDYERWIRELVEVFGGVYDFMGLNSITTHEEDYADLHHFYPYIGELIADRITNVPNSKLPEDFGIFVTKTNLESHLALIRERASKIKPK